jgi:uncharacterized Zn-finger protein
MGWNDHLNDNVESQVICKHCGKKYLQWEENQVPGFRDKDHDYCPYCGESNGSSMSVEFHNRKLEDK